MPQESQGSNAAAAKPAPDAQPAQDVQNTSSDKAADAPKEAVITDKDGQTKRVTIVNGGDGARKTVPVDREKADKLQQSVDAGHQPWLLDPVQVIKTYGKQYGFDPDQDTFTLLSYDTQRTNHDTGEAYVLVGHGDDYYLVRLVQPTGAGRHKIWQIDSIRQVEVIKESAPNVGPGVEGLDYDKLLKAQQAVDEGRELWRPVGLVQRRLSQEYGFCHHRRL